MTPKNISRRVGGISAAVLAAMAAHTALAQTDTQIPLNYNWHATGRPADALFSVSSVNSDVSTNLYRSIADRGFVFDPTDPNSLGSYPMIGATGITYSLFNSLGYTNTTWPNAAANGLDTVVLANRVLNSACEFFANQTTQPGPFPVWSPAATVTSLSAAAGSISSSPGLVTVTTSAAHGLRAGDTVLIGGANPALSTSTTTAFTFPHPLNGSYAIAAVPDSTHFVYADSTANATASGLRYANNIPATGVSASSGVVTVTTSVPHGLAVGNTVTVSGVTPVGYNGTYTVASVPSTTTFTYSNATTGSSSAAMLLNSTTTISSLTSNTTTVTATTGTTANGLTTGSSATITGANIQACNGAFTVTVPTASISSITSTTTTATAMTSAPHPFTSGQAIAVAGASFANHNVTAATVTVPAVTVSYLTGNGSTVTATTPSNTFVNGQMVTISGAYPAAYNGTYAITVVDGTHFTYSSSATGTLIGTPTATSANVFTYPITSGSGTSTTATATTPFVFTYPLTTQGTMTVRPSTGFAGPGFALVALQGNGSVVTGTVGGSASGVAHGFTVGQSITISNVNPPSYNGTFVVTSIPSTTTFTYADTNAASTTGTFIGAGTLDRSSSDQVTTLASPLTADAHSQVGVVFMGSNNGGQFDTVLTFGTGPSATNFTARLAAPDWCGGTADAAPVAGQTVVSQTRLAHPISATVYDLSGDGSTVTADTAMPHGFVVGNTITISGETGAGYNGTFTVATIGSSTSNMLATTGLVGNSGVVTATTSAAHSFSVGQSVFISGATPASFNGIYTVASAPDSTHFTYADANAINGPSTSASTSLRSYFTFANNISGPSAGVIWAVNAASVYTSFRGVSNTDSDQLNTFTTTAGAGCPNLRVTEGVIGLPNSFAGQQLTQITFKNATWNNSQTLTSLSGNGTFATASVSTSGYIPGQVINIRGANPPSFNGTYTIASVPSSSSVTFACAATGAASVAGTIDRNGGGRGWTIHAATFRTNAPPPSNPNGLPTTAAAAVAGTGAAGDNAGTVLGAFDGMTTPTGGGADYFGVWYSYTATGSSAHLCEARTCLDGQNTNVAPLPQVTGVTGVRTNSANDATVVLPMDTTIAIYSGPATNPTFVTGNDDGCSVSSRVQWTATPGTTYLIRVASKAAFTGNSSLFILHIDDPIHTDITMPLQFNWNGICHGTTTSGPLISEQTLPGSGTSPASAIGSIHENRSDLNGYRGISDRGFLFDPNGVTTNALNYGGTVGYQGMAYSLYNTPLQSDMIYLGNRIGTWPWSPMTTLWPSQGGTSTAAAGYQPLWAGNDDHTGPQDSSMTGLNATFGPNTKIGILYHVSNVGVISGTTPYPANFDVTLTFADGATVTTTVQGTDWYGGTGNPPPYNMILPAATGVGLEVQRILGLYHGVQNTDIADDAPSGALKCEEAVISTTSLLAAGFDPTAHGILTKFTLGNPLSGNAAHNATGSGFGIYAATLRDPASFNLNFPPSGAGTVTPNMLTVGANGLMTVHVSRGSGSPNNITSVTVDASSLGLSGTFALNDSHQNGDAAANDNTWSANIGFPINATPGAFSLPFTVTDAQSRTASGNIIFTLVGPTGSAIPNPVMGGQNALLVVTLSPTTGGPADIASVTVDCSALGLASNVSLNDLGQNGDATTHDGMWSANITVPANTVGQFYSLPVTITDVSSRSGSGAINLTVIGPPPAQDLGTIGAGSPVNFAGSIDTAAQVKWVKFTLASPIDAALGNYLDIDTEGSLLVTLNDTIIGLFDSNGNFITSDDDSGSGNLSQISYGVSCPARPAVGDGLPYNGHNGLTLPAGTYYLAYSGFLTSYATGWSATSTSTYTGSIAVNIKTGSSSLAGGIPTATDLGSITATSTPTVINGTGNIGAGGVTWFKFTLTADVNGAVPTFQYLDIDTEGSAISNTIMALFRDDGSGTLVSTDDDDGSGTYSQFSYGAGTRPAVGDGTAYNGRDGATLTAGTYYIAVAESPASFCSNFVVAFNGGQNAGGVNLNIHAGIQSPIVAGPIVDPDNNHTYYLLNTGFSWQQAEDYAVNSLHGHLAQIQDADEDNFIAFNVIPFDGFNHTAFIGLFDPPTDPNYTTIPNPPTSDARLWQWTTGEPFGGFVNWSNGEPNNGPGAVIPGQEHYGEMISAGGTWNDIGLTGNAGDIIYSVVEVAGGGVCCRGSTCNTTVAQASCVGSGRAGAFFAGTATTCNSGRISHTPCCYGDYNKVNGITVQDIFDFLADWFAGSAYAKVGSDGATPGVTVQNIFDFLGNWFAGGCS